MRGILDFFRGPIPERLLLKDYRVGVVVSNQGLNDKQLLELGHRLDFISHMTTKDATIQLFVPGFNMADAEESVPREVRNLLERKAKCRVIYIGTRGDHKDGVAENIYSELMSVKRCDEVWCCPSLGQTANSSARVAQVYRIGCACAKPGRFKLIPPWVEPPVSAAPTKKPVKKGPPWMQKRKSSYR